MPYVVRTSRLHHIRRPSTSHLIIAAETPRRMSVLTKDGNDACRLAKDSNLRPLSVINTRSDLAGWPRATWYHIESLCPLPCIYIPIVLWSRPSVDPLTYLLIKLLKSYSLVLKDHTYWKAPLPQPTTRRPAPAAPLHRWPHRPGPPEMRYMVGAPYPPLSKPLMP